MERERQDLRIRVEGEGLRRDQKKDKGHRERRRQPREGIHHEHMARRHSNKGHMAGT